MCKKVLALGNRLMMDDKIALLATESLQSTLESNGFEVIICETDIDYSFSQLNHVDEFFIIDSTYFGNEPGTITVKALSDIKKSYQYKKQTHSLNLLDLINIYDIDIKGYFIGIEVCSIEINYEISIMLKMKFQAICDEILKVIL